MNCPNPLCYNGVVLNEIGEVAGICPTCAGFSCIQTEEPPSAPALSPTTEAEGATFSHNLVHNHGPEEGKGLGCKETLVDGKLRGECLDWYGDQDANNE